MSCTKYTGGNLPFRHMKSTQIAIGCQALPSKEDVSHSFREKGNGAGRPFYPAQRRASPP